MSNNVVPGWFLRKSLRCLCLCEHCELCSMNKSAQPLSGRRESRKNPPGKPPGIYHHPLTMSAMSLQRLQNSSQKKLLTLMLSTCKKVNNICRLLRSNSNSESWQLKWHFALRRHLSAKCLLEFAHVTIICSNLKFIPKSPIPPTLRPQHSPN